MPAAAKFLAPRPAEAPNDTAAGQPITRPGSLIPTFREPGAATTGPGAAAIEAPTSGKMPTAAEVLAPRPAGRPEAAGGPPLRAMPESGFIDPASVRFSQDSFKQNFKDGRSVKDLVDGLRTGRVQAKDIPPIMLMERDGKLYSFDNRRLFAFQEAGVPIRYRMGTPKEIDDQIANGKFSTVNDGTSIRMRGGGK